jgi:hypothetical protein
MLQMKMEKASEIANEKVKERDTRKREAMREMEMMMVIEMEASETAEARRRYVRISCCSFSFILSDFTGRKGKIHPSPSPSPTPSRWPP